MAILPIVIFPDPVLSQKALEIEEVGGEIKKLMADMLETMYSEPGIGLAAPQVGVSRRVIVVDIGKEGERSPIFLANPEIIERDGEITFEEGCLSLPDFNLEVTRSNFVRVRGINESGEEVVHDAEGLLAVVFQHEIDHLDGILLVDKVSRLKRDMYRRKLKKEQKRVATSS